MERFRTGVQLPRLHHLYIQYNPLPIKNKKPHDILTGLLMVCKVTQLKLIGGPKTHLHQVVGSAAKINGHVT